MLLWHRELARLDGLMTAVLSGMERDPRLVQAAVTILRRRALLLGLRQDNVQ